MDQPTNLDLAIAVLERVSKEGYAFSMSCWQQSMELIMENEKEAHEYGAVCCAGGWLAISSECKDKGLEVSECGAPAYGGYEEYVAMALFLDTDFGTAFDIFGTAFAEDIYGKEFDYVTAQDVADKLRQLRDTGEINLVSNE